MCDNTDREFEARTTAKVHLPGLLLIGFLTWLVWFAPNLARAADLASPDGTVVIDFHVSDTGGPCYSVDYRGRPVLAECRLGFALDGARDLTNGFRVTEITRSNQDQTWHPVYGERSEVRDHHNQMVVRLQDDQSPPRHMQLTFRAYNTGAAFCYTIPTQDDWKTIRIKGENTQFSFCTADAENRVSLREMKRPTEASHDESSGSSTVAVALPLGGDHTAWPVYSAQGKYAEVPLSQIRPGCERPLVVRIDDEIYAAVTEARLVDFARMRLSPVGDRAHTLVSTLSGPVQTPLPLRSPWRVVMLADSPARLLESNDIIQNLNDPCAIDEPSWIRPGKVIREVTLTTIGGKACVDFAVKHNLQYVEFDAGWYGHEYSDDSDATTVTVDPKRSPGPLDLPEVIRYADQRGIGILLYVNRRALERQLDEILPLYQSWGIKGVKYGFVDVGSQQATHWLHEAVRKAAAHRLMVDVHDEYRPTGYSRTYPNLMTQEGIGGDETSPTNRQTLTILFTRMLAGAADNTICYYDDRVDRNASHAYQLAKSVCLYSPWQFLYWYDRPPSSPQEKGGAGGSKHLIGDEPELAFFDSVPTVWDDTRVLEGEIGQFAVIARRSGRDWFVGCMNADRPRELSLPLDFLEAESAYRATIYFDDPHLATRTRVGVCSQAVDSQTILTVSLSAQGGQAIRIVPDKR